MTWKVEVSNRQMVIASLIWVGTGVVCMIVLALVL